MEYYRDIGLRLVDHAIQCGVLRDHITIESVARGKEVVLRIKDECKKMPVFLACDCHGHPKLGVAMSYDAKRVWLTL